MTRLLALALLALAGCPSPVATTDDPATDTSAASDTTGGPPSTGGGPTPTTDITTTTDIATTDIATTSLDITTTTDIATTDITTADITTDTSTGDTTGEPPAPTCVALPLPLAVQWSLTAPLPDAVAKLALTPAGDLALLGSEGSHPNSDVRVELRDGAGAVKWADTYAGVNGLDDTALDLAVDAAGNVHVLLLETLSAIMVEQGTIADQHLVVLRYAPDGAHLWRWELQHEHGPPPISWTSHGRLAIVDDTIAVLVHYGNAPRVLHTLDAFGNHLGAVTLALPDPELPAYKVRQAAIASDGTVVLTADDFQPPNSQDHMWIGRFAADGSLAWSTLVGNMDDKTEHLLLGPDGDIFLVWNERLGQKIYQRHVQRWEPDHDPSWTLDLAAGINVRGGSVRCDGTLLLTGGIDEPAGPELEWDKRVDLWLGVIPPGDPLTAFQHAFGPPFSYGSAHTVASSHSADLRVGASYLADDGMHYVPWIARLAP